LVDAMVADAREQGFKVGPACSYVAAKFDQHPEWADLRASGFTQARQTRRRRESRSRRGHRD
jgi:hypothetical protein